MDGWMDAWMDGWMDGWTDGWVGGWDCIGMNNTWLSIHGWMDRLADEVRFGTDGCIGGQTERHKNFC